MVIEQPGRNFIPVESLNARTLGRGTRAAAIGRPLVVFLAHLHSTTGKNLRVTVPLGMTYVHSYLRARFGDAIQIRQLATTQQINEALNEQVPDIFAFGNYSWNTALTNAVIGVVKQRHPKVVVAVAGPNIPTEKPIAQAGLRRNRAADFYISREGEHPLANLVETCLGLADPSDVRGTVVDGCYSLTEEGLVLQGDPLDRVGVLEEIPSPYLTGLCDDFLANPEFIPLLQTSRGCPYRCTFCVAGHDWWSKLRAFSVERVKEEIDYIQARTSNPLLRIADENFGILPRDVEIAEHVRKVKDTFSYPSVVQVYTDKHLTRNVKQVTLLMRDLIPLNISFQSLDKQVLKNIKRVNVKDTAIEEAAAFAREHSLVLSTELIFGLPGETIESFTNSLDKVLDYRFDNVVIYALNILDQAEMAFAEYREKFGLKTRFALSENGYSEYDSVQTFEMDELVVATSTIPEQEYLRFFKFIFFFNFALFYGWLRELVFFFETNGVRATSVIRAMLADSEQCPTLAEFAGRFLTGHRAMMRDTREEVAELIRELAETQPEQVTDNQFGAMRYQYAVFSDLFTEGRFAEVVHEFAQSGLRLHRELTGETPSDSFLEQLDVITQLQIQSFIPLHEPVPETVALKSGYDLVGWKNSNFRQPLADFALAEPATFSLRIEGYQHHERLWDARDRDDIRRIYLRSFASTNANRRRHLELCEEAPPA
ncbi:B12-binding domain-containing radical SAM protein [Micromonospora rubida]|uniref:B12-binding domain-containing radical SAM protein n=1 Tax=Micromonospora rubida TaxID=2697657 RepID=UPI0013768198|nr:radical SAM protein [Micromonospora rubida]NBE83251.1 radical SAM protein [Micromonospora rubida]